MIKVWIYGLLIIMITILCLVRKKNALGILLWGLYALIAFFACICVSKGWFSKYLNTDILPYAFLVLVYVISFAPFLSKDEFKGEKFASELPLQFRWFAYAYIFAAGVTIALYIIPVKNLIVSGRWYENIEDMYAGNIVFPYRNIIEYLCIQFAGYLRLLAIVLGFSFLRTKEDIKIGLLLVGAAVISGALGALYISSRGTLINILLLTVSVFIFFFDQYDLKTRKGIMAILGLVLLTIIPFFSSITVSRFSSDEATSSVLQYLGQAPIVFSGGVSGITQYGYGINGFGTFFNQRVSQAEIGGSWGSGFYTFVGWIFLDWGPIGTLILVSIISYILWNIISKDKYELSDLFLIFFIYYTLLQGVFVIGRAYCYQIVMALVVYVFLKIFSDNREYYLGIYGDELNTLKTKTQPKTCKYFK